VERHSTPSGGIKTGLDLQRRGNSSFLFMKALLNRALILLLLRLKPLRAETADESQEAPEQDSYKLCINLPGACGPSRRGVRR
jgi:hypothetical protein